MVAHRSGVAKSGERQRGPKASEKSRSSPGDDDVGSAYRWQVGGALVPGEAQTRPQPARSALLLGDKVPVRLDVLA